MTLLEISLVLGGFFIGVVVCLTIYALKELREVSADLIYLEQQISTRSEK